MAEEQLPDAVREFTDLLRGLLGRLDRYAGWCLVFWQRDPEGMRACLEGREPPPWDVVESLLQDLAAAHGPSAAEAELSRARSLHAEATAAFDARPGARRALSDRLDVMLREQRYAADRRADLTRRLAAAANHAEAEALRNDLAWAEDDHRRATARCAELTARTSALDDRARATSPAHTQGRFTSRRTPAVGAAGPQDAHPVPAGRGRTSAQTGRNPPPSAPAHGSTRADASPPLRGDRGQSPAGQEGGGPTPPGPSSADRAPGPSWAAPAHGSTANSGGPGSSRVSHGRGPTPADPGQVLSSAVPAYGFVSSRGGEGPSPAGRGLGPAPDDLARGPAPAPAHGSPHPRPTRQAAGRRASVAPEAHPSPHTPRQGLTSRPHGHPAPPDPVPPELRAAQQRVPPPAPAEAAKRAPARERRRGGARFAGVEGDGAAPLVAPAGAVPELPVAATAARGARFAGAAAETETGARPQEGRAGEEDLREVAHLVRTLARLRREGRSGDAHVLLNEAAYWPAVRFPLLAGEMERAGLAADWATLLWEAAATLPAERLVAAADALTAGGRAGDGEQILRQGVVRPAAEIGHAALALADGTRHRELRALLDACVRMRTPQDAARTAAPDPGRLVPLLLTAARGVSEERHWDVLHALRVAGLTA
ncbi:hypothetical protein ACH46L_23675 [Streptomyces althioticus]|uniref:hypothetical protein n=1 Tax=Streptomyces althioticus TaxID=83380 RepID=UPI0037AC1314